MTRSRRGGYFHQRGRAANQGNRAAALLSHVGRSDGQRDTYSNVRGNGPNQHFVNPSRSSVGTPQHFNHSSTASTGPQYFNHSSAQSQNYTHSGYSNQYSTQSPVNMNHSSSGKERRASTGLLGQSPYPRNVQNESWGSAGMSNVYPSYGDSSGYGGSYNNNNFMENMTANITEIVSKNLASLLGHQGHGYPDNRSSSYGRAIEDRLGPVPHKTQFIVRDNIGPKKFDRIRASNAVNRRPVVRNRPPVRPKQPIPPKANLNTSSSKKKRGDKRSTKMAFTKKGAKERAKLWKTVKVDYTLTMISKIVNLEKEVIVIDSENPATLEDAEPKTAEPMAAEPVDAEPVAAEPTAAEPNDAEMETDTPVDDQPETTVVVRPDSVEPAEHENLDFGDDIPDAVPPQSEEISAENGEDASKPEKSELDAPTEVTDITPTEIVDEVKEVQVIETAQGKRNKNKFTQPRMMKDDIIKLTVDKTACAIHSMFVEAEMKIADLLGKSKDETPYFSITLSTNSEGIENAPGKLFEEGFEVPNRNTFKYLNHLPIFRYTDEWRSKV